MAAWSRPDLRDPVLLPWQLSIRFTSQRCKLVCKCVAIDSIAQCMFVTGAQRQLPDKLVMVHRVIGRAFGNGRRALHDDEDDDDKSDDDYKTQGEPDVCF